MSDRELGNPLGNPLAVARAPRTELALRGEVSFLTPGTHYWTVPAGVYSICAVCIGAGGYSSGPGGGGGGGGVAYKNNIPVTPGQVIRIVVGDRAASSAVPGGSTTIAEDAVPGIIIVGAEGGKSSQYTTTGAAGGAIIAGDGGSPGRAGGNGQFAGSGGAGGYIDSDAYKASNGAGDSTNGRGQGGGQWLYGTSGWALSPDPGVPSPSQMARSGKPIGGYGLFFGCGGWNGGKFPAASCTGAARILWGDNRAFPATNVGLESI